MKLIPADKSTLKSIKKLYKVSFPSSEKKPFSLIRSMARLGKMSILALIDDEEFIGLVITINGGNDVLIDYFAIAEDKRGKGYGTAAMPVIFEHFSGKRLVVEIESTKEADADNASERDRRKRFYESNGWTAMDFQVFLFGVDMEILTNGCAITFPEYYEILANVFGNGRLIQNNVRLLDIADETLD